MTCSEITRELALPTGAVDAAEVERHLAACSACASRAEVERGFDRLWNASRPTEPSPGAFERLWAGIDTAVPSPARNGVLAAEVITMNHVRKSVPERKRFARRAAIVAAVALAQAASILLTAVIVTRYGHDRDVAIDTTGPEVADRPEGSAPASDPSPTPQGADAKSLAQLVFVVEEGQTLIFRLGDDRDGQIEVHPRLIDLADDLVAFEGDLADPIALAAADQLDINLLNAMEGMGDLAFFHDDESDTDTSRGGASGTERDLGNPPLGPSAQPASPTLRELILPALVGLIPPYAEPAKPFRQVTVFGIVATPEDHAVDPRLDMIADDLRKLKPGHGFQMNSVSSRRLASGESLARDLGDGIVAHVELEDSLDLTTGKLRIRFTMEVDGRETFTTTVATSPNQVFFCDKPLGDGVRMLIGIGAR